MLPSTRREEEDDREEGGVGIVGRLGHRGRNPSSQKIREIRAPGAAKEEPTVYLLFSPHRVQLELGSRRSVIAGIGKGEAEFQKNCK